MTPTQITADTTVREVMTRYPGAERIFSKYGLMGCGGPQGPVEPIGWFARAHAVVHLPAGGNLSPQTAKSPAVAG